LGELGEVFGLVLDWIGHQLAQVACVSATACHSIGYVLPQCGYVVAFVDRIGFAAVFRLVYQVQAHPVGWYCQCNLAAGFLFFCLPCLFFGGGFAATNQHQRAPQ